MDTVVIYPGRFHPFHKGHKSVYDTLVKRFGKDRVYIATSNKVDPPKSPFTFDEKRAMMALTGVDPSRVVQVKNPYQATEITDNYDPQNTIALFAVSDKDMAEDPRFSFKPRKDGQPSYYQPAQKDMVGFDKHAYILTIPTLRFNVLGEPMRSATEFRANFARADNDKQKSMITDLFGRYDPNVHKTMAQKIVEQLQRADEILDKLIELGADDEYILEACARVDMLKNRVLKENRRQSLYQAIMEGGHSLPETAVTQEEITDFNKEDPMNSVIAIRGIGTMSISSALEKVSEMAMDIAKLGAMKDAKNVQDNLPRYMDLLATYNESIQQAYRELAAQRRRGGTASRGIDKDITEELSDEEMDAFHVELDKLVHKYFGHSSDEKREMDEGDYNDALMSQNAISHILKQADIITSRLGPKAGNMYLQTHSKDFSRAGVKIPNMNKNIFKIVGEATKDLSLDDVDPKLRPVLQQAITKYPFAKNALDAALHMMMDQMKSDFKQDTEINRLDRENDSQDKDIDNLERKVAKEHCGDPMADDHKPVRMLLMKLYQKEMECVPGSPEHFEVMQMIDGCRKDIGLDENINEEWSDKYKRSIDCDNPRGFSQKAHCAGRKK